METGWGIIWELFESLKCTGLTFMAQLNYLKIHLYPVISFYIEKNILLQDSSCLCIFLFSTYFRKHVVRSIHYYCHCNLIECLMLWSNFEMIAFHVRYSLPNNDKIIALSQLTTLANWPLGPPYNVIMGHMCG